MKFFTNSIQGEIDAKRRGEEFVNDHLKRTTHEQYHQLFKEFNVE